MNKMYLSPGRLRRQFFGVSLEETAFTKQGFSQGTRQAQAHFQMIVYAFQQGYQAAIEDDRFEALIPSLQTIEAEFRGFAFEGAALALTLFDFFSPWKRRFQALLQGPGASHSYELSIGAGWALRWLPRNPARFMNQLHPLLAWLAVDGYGFSQGFFSCRRFLQDQVLPARLSGYASRVFDQGLGRSLWFVKGADVLEIIATIQAFPPSRQSDLWSGIGVACAYAGGIESDGIQALGKAAGRDRPHLAQGATFAAMARKQAGNQVGYTDLACEILSGMASEEAIHLSSRCGQGLPQNAQAYEIWRSRVRGELIERSNIFISEGE